jgi:phosphatidylserine decarboxylase
LTGEQEAAMSIAREGWSYILILLATGGLLLALQLMAPGGLLVCLALFTAFFFRDPERAIPGDPLVVVSPADGKIVRIEPASGNHPLGDGTIQVSIFLSIFDVHINRTPIAGRVERVEYHPGEFLPAFDDKASLRNEQNAVTVADGEFRVLFKQIAGLIARRIVFRKRLDDTLARGERVGLIKFGSRVDVFLPRGVEILVKVGDRVSGGSSAIGRRA